MLPYKKRSESAVDLGTLQDMERFFKLLGFDGNTTWETMEEPETHNWATIATEDAARAAATTLQGTAVLGSSILVSTVSYKLTIWYREFFF